MNDEPTPETDNFILINAGSGPTDYQWRLHSRSLEIERDEFKKKQRENSKGINRLVKLNENLLAELIACRQEQEKAKAKWISTDLALPDDDATVLIHMDDGTVWTGFLDAGTWRYVSGDSIESRVLHWRPFPEPPEAAK